MKCSAKEKTNFLNRSRGAADSPRSVTDRSIPSGREARVTDRSVPSDPEVRAPDITDLMDRTGHAARMAGPGTVPALTA